MVAAQTRVVIIERGEKGLNSECRSKVESAQHACGWGME